MVGAQASIFPFICINQVGKLVLQPFCYHIVRMLFLEVVVVGLGGGYFPFRLFDN